MKIFAVWFCLLALFYLVMVGSVLVCLEANGRETACSQYRLRFLERMLHRTQVRVLTDGSRLQTAVKYVTSQWQCLWSPEKIANAGYRNAGNRQAGESKV